VAGELQSTAIQVGGTLGTAFLVAADVALAGALIGLLTAPATEAPKSPTPDNSRVDVYLVEHEVIR
jgi:hypothetical protein